MTITLQQVQDAIARCFARHPIVNQELPKQSLPLAELLGLMAYARAKQMDWAELTPTQQQAFQQWSQAPDASGVSGPDA
jgi:hypothetical protein